MKETSARATQLHEQGQSQHPGGQGQSNTLNVEIYRISGSIPGWPDTRPFLLSSYCSGSGRNVERHRISQPNISLLLVNNNISQITDISTLQFICKLCIILYTTSMLSNGATIMLSYSGPAGFQKFESSTS